MWLFAVLILWPLVEISLFVTLGGWLGLWLSLAIVLGTAFLGVTVIRAQGVRGTETIRAALNRGQDPALPAAKGALRVLAGVMLFLPGFLTDALGLVLLLPPVQAAVIAGLASRVNLRPHTHTRPPTDVLEGEWSRVDPPGQDSIAGGGSRPGSGWTRH